MSERLPTELVLEILRRTAVENIHVDRSVVVRLALTSRFVYELVHPTLYHTMVITDSNRSDLYLLAREPACAHIFRAVRRLLVYGDSFRHWEWVGIDPRLLSSVKSIDVCFAALETFCKILDFRPLEIAVRYASLEDVGPDLPATTRRSITHITGFFLGGAPNHNVSAGDITLMLGMLPALTHIAFDAVDFSQDPLDVAALEAVLRACLSSSRVRAVVIRVSGRLLPAWPDVLDCARGIRDPRVYAWEDTRLMYDWDGYDACMAADGRAGRSIWSDAVSVQTGAQVP